MLAEPNGANAQIMRRSLGEVVTGDWKKVLRAAASAELIEQREAHLLNQALDHSVGSPRRSEFYAAYFRSLDAFASKDRERASDAVRNLGNVLVEDVVRGLVDLPVPLAQQTGTGSVHLPAATADFEWVSARGTSFVEPDFARSEGGEALKAIAATWIGDSTDGVRLRTETAAIRDEVVKYERQTKSISRLDPELGVAGRDDDLLSVLLGKYQAGMELIAGVSEQQAAEIRELTEYVVPVTGQHFVGGSDIALFGATYLRLEPDWSALCFADHLTHEASHQLLHAKQQLHPLLLNREEIGPASPIRSDPRPLYGSYHATFVFLRLAKLMAAVLQSASTQWHDEARVRFHRHLLGLLQGLAIISEHGKFSVEGQRELDEWIEEARVLVALEGLPNRTLYDRLDWDYDKPNSALPFFPV